MPIIPAFQKAGAGGFLWSWGQPGLQSKFQGQLRKYTDTLSKKQKKEINLSSLSIKTDIDLENVPWIYLHSSILTVCTTKNYLKKLFWLYSYLEHKYRNGSRFFESVCKYAVNNIFKILDSTTHGSCSLQISYACKHTDGIFFHFHYFLKIFSSWGLPWYFMRNTIFNSV